MNITIEISGQEIPTAGHARILTYGDIRTGYVSELSGPWEAFDLKEGSRFDSVKVIKPELVSIKTLRVL